MRTNKSFTTKSEKDIYQRLRDKKWTLVKNGYPDYLCILPSGELAFVEVKANLNQSVESNFSKEQCAILTLFSMMGFKVLIADKDTICNITPEIINEGKKYWEHQLCKSIVTTKRFTEKDWDDFFVSSVKGKFDERIKRLERKEITRQSVESRFKNQIINDCQAKLDQKCIECFVKHDDEIGYKKQEKKLVEEAKISFRARVPTDDRECYQCIFTRGLACKTCCATICPRHGKEQKIIWDEILLEMKKRSHSQVN